MLQALRLLPEVTLSVRIDSRDSTLRTGKIPVNTRLYSLSDVQCTGRVRLTRRQIFVLIVRSKILGSSKSKLCSPQALYICTLHLGQIHARQDTISVSEIHTRNSTRYQCYSDRVLCSRLHLACYTLFLRRGVFFWSG